MNQTAQFEKIRLMQLKRAHVATNLDFQISPCMNETPRRRISTLMLKND